MSGQSNWQGVIERTVSALGYDPVDLERSSKGLLRVFIDRMPGDPSGESITVDDCEKVTRQLQYVLEVEGVEYQRLEVSSPGLDRPLKRPADWVRFSGSEVEVTLRAPLAGRRKYRGELQPNGDTWRLILREGKTEQALDFSLDEVREARLVPVLDFKGRGRRTAPQPLDGGQEQ